MTRPSVSCAIVGYGAIAESHVAALRAADVPVRAVVGPKPAAVSAFAQRYAIPRAATSLDAVLAAADVDAVVIASPSAVHAEQAIAALRHGKHVLCEIPVGLSLADAEAVHDASRETGLVAMVCHTQRFWPPMVALRDDIERRGIAVRHVVARTTMRRHGIGWTGYRRSWVDNLLWHHGCHAVDSTLELIWWPAGVGVRGLRTALPANRNLPMDIGVLLKSTSASIGTIALSYNSMIPSSDYLVIADEDSYFLDGGRLFGRDGGLLAGGDAAAMQNAAVAAQDGDFIAVGMGAEPRLSVESALPAMRVLARLQDMDRSAEVDRESPAPLPLPRHTRRAVPPRISLLASASRNRSRPTRAR